LVATGNTWTITDPTGTADGLIVTVATAGDDNLAVSLSGRTLAIALASTTDTKNTPAVEVQAAVRAIASDRYNFSSFILTGSDVAGSGVTGTKTMTMALNQPYKYVPNGFVKAPVAVAPTMEVSVVTRGAVREGSLPYPVDAVIKAQLPLIQFNS
jgi:hypothetical protein